MPDERPAKRVLLIDDDIVILRLLALALQKHGYETFTAKNGVEAIELLKREAVDIILLDLMMPVMDVLRFLRWLRDEAQMSTPTVVFTSRETARTEEEVMKAGATLLLYKPLEITELVNRLQAL